MKITGKTNKVDDYTFESSYYGIICNIKKDSNVYILENDSILIVFASANQEYALISDARYYQPNEIFVDKLLELNSPAIDLVDPSVDVLGKGVSTIAQIDLAGEKLNILFER